MNVLSLFDGISCGQVALERAGVVVDSYFASEIDKYAIQITQKNYPNTVQLGDVTKIVGSNLPKIDLLIGGSPCQGFSFGGKQLNFEDPRSKLFFEYVRILKELQQVNPNIRFLLENVKMKKEYQDVISSYLGVEPITINSNLVSAQNRPRLYWTNIEDVKLPDDKGIVLNDILDTNPDNFSLWHEWQMRKWFGRCYVRQDYYRIEPLEGKVQCLMAQFGMNFPKIWLDSAKTVFRRLTSLELERLQTLPDNYTQGLTNRQRSHALGNGWTVDVIAHIFKNIPKGSL